jgi:hypothetical protein
MLFKSDRTLARTNYLIFVLFLWLGSRDHSMLVSYCKLGAADIGRGD